MNKLFKILFIITTSMVSLSAAASHIVEVKATGFTGAKGKAIAAIYNSKSGFASDLEDAAFILNTTITNNEANFTFESIEPGTYAVFVFHDEDDNDEFKTNWIGFPKEGAANSNNHQGIPSFKKSSVTVSGDTQIIVEMWYP